MKRESVTLKGIGASQGIALGYVHFLERGNVTISKRSVPASEVKVELKRFENALEEARKQLTEIRKRVSEEQGEEHLYLIEAQILMLEDKSLTEDTREILQARRINAEWAVSQALERFKSMFDKIDDEYFRDRRSDIEYVEERLVRILAGSKEREYVSLTHKTILVAHDLSPSDIAKLHREHLAGFATDVGGRTSHTTIVARSLGIPIMVGLGDVTEQAENGDRAIIDAIDGLFIINPDTKTWSDYEKRREAFLKTKKELLKNRHFKAETKDQYAIHLQANLDFVEEIPSVIENGAEGVGMLRTEHLFLGGTIPVSEEDQFQSYKKVVEAFKDRTVIIRMLDLAGDEIFAPPLGLRSEPSPALGLRGMRLLLKEKELLLPQFRAILKASAHGHVGIMYPMVTHVQEVQKANTYLRQVMSELKAEGVPFDPDVTIGALIETPAAALLADHFAQEVDFLSIGTNDLTQYTMAADRTNRLVAHLYDPIHPAMLMLLKRVVELGHKAGIEVGVCGEMASEPAWIPLLVGLEFNFLSMTPESIPVVKQMIRSLRMDECKQWLEKAMKADSAPSFRADLDRWYQGATKEISP